MRRAQENCVVNVCQPGSNLLSAGYCMYSSSVILVVSIGKGVRAPSAALRPPPPLIGPA